MSLSNSLALKELVKFSVPIMLGQLGIILIATGDLIVAGNYSRECLAAIGLAVSLANPPLMIGVGILFAVSPILAQKRGRGEDVNNYFWSVVVFSLLVGILCTLITMGMVNILPYLGYSENLNKLIREYLWISSFSTIGLCLYQGIKEFFQSQEKAVSANIWSILAVGANLFLAYALAFGKFGFPNLKEAGLAWACVLVRMFLGFGMLLISFKLWKTDKKLRFDFFKEVSTLGLPLTLSIFFEVMAFCSVTLFVGKFDEVQVAANNLALNIGHLAFMVPLSLASAIAVKVGHAYGEKNLFKIRVYSRVGLMISITTAILMGLLFYIFPEFVLSMFNSDTEVMEWGKRLLFWVACFQLFDGAQVTLSGILRGLSITRASSIATFIGYWLIGIPLGYYLGFYRDMEAQGFWAGLTLSLGLVALMLAFYLKSKMKSLVVQGF